MPPAQETRLESCEVANKRNASDQTLLTREQILLFHSARIRAASGHDIGPPCT